MGGTLAAKEPFAAFKESGLGLFVGFILWIVFAVASSTIAGSKGRSGGAWFFVGLVLGPVGLFVYLLPKVSGTEFRTCPYCAELVRTEAVKCRYCASELEAEREPRKTGKPISTSERAELKDRYAALDTARLEQLLVDSAGLREGAEDLIREELKHRPLTPDQTEQSS